MRDILDNIVQNKQTLEYRFFETYNSTCLRLPKAKILSTSRKRKIRARIKEFGEKNVFKILEIIDKSNFLCGENGRGWRANFDWILESRNFVKILEGNYNNPIKTTQNEYNNTPNNRGFNKPNNTQQHRTGKVCGVTELLGGDVRIPDFS